MVFHQAALRITHCAAEPREAIEVMVDATFDLLDLCVKHEVEKVVAASSASIYGLADSFPTPETHHPYDNRTLYGAAKVFNEGLLRSFNDMYGLDYVALRYFNVYGPRMDIHGKYTEVLIRWMERIDARPSRRSSSATAARRWTSSMSATSPAPTSSRPGPTRPTWCSTSQRDRDQPDRARPRAGERDGTAGPRSRSTGRSGRSTRCRGGWPIRARAGSGSAS